MYATINLPGSQHFRYYGPGTRAECERWLEEQKKIDQNINGGMWVSSYFPARIVSNRVARGVRYKDGSRVISGESL